jgi:nitroreductase
MLAARAKGLHTCAEAAIASYPDIVRRELDIANDWIVICGMALGYADPDAVINTFQPPRIALEEYAVFLD